MDQTVSCRSLAAEASVQSHYIPYGICGRQRGTETGYSSSTLFAGVIIIKPVLHTRSFTTDAI
jgi:hypothetical protein